MKKLMIAAAAVALAGVATAANIYDYKASVKYVDLTKKTVNARQYYVKSVKSATLQGYFVPTADCACKTGVDSTGGLKPGFLVIQNKAKNSGVKILPANLLVDIWNTSVGTIVNGSALQAQGYLFAGFGKAAIPAAASPAYMFGDTTTRGTYKLFGAYNTQNNASKAFVDAWLDASGFGKAKYSVDEEGCVITDGYCLHQLKGSVIGGMYLCEGNQFGEWWMCQAWDGTTDVITGTWQIKANSGIKNGVALNSIELAMLSNFDPSDDNDVKELEFVKAAAQKITAGYSLLTIDAEFRQAWF